MAYEWLAGNSPTNEIEQEHRPTRLAVTVTACVGRNGAAAILLVNPHPDTWNNWQFPYASIQKDLPEPVEASTLGDIEAEFEAAGDPAAPDIAARAAGEIGELLGQEVNHLGPRAVLETYALRFSKSANVWTAYRFAYLPARIHSGELAVRHYWLGLGEEADLAAKTGQVDGLEFSDNVLAILRDAEMRRAVVGGLNEEPSG